MELKHILAISGSTRRDSSNLQLIKAISILFKEKCTIEIFNEIASLPHFNPDLETAEELEQVNNFRQLINNADGVLICTPEYAHGVPGSLKNAIDWTVSSNNFYYKPTALITASTDGQFGHKALLETLTVIEAKDINQLQLIVPFIKTKINAANILTNEKTLKEITQLIEGLLETINHS